MTQLSRDGRQAGTLMDASSVLITEELGWRPQRAPDFAAEHRALDALTRELAAQPRAVMHMLARLVTELCHADAAGISILECRSGEEVFCWRAVAGTLGGYVGVVVPRYASPCGMTLASNATLLFNRVTEQRFPAVADIKPPVFETLLTPLYKDGEPIGAIWALSHDPGRRFDAEDARLLGSLAHFASAAHQMVAALDAVAALQQEALERGRIENSLCQFQKMEAVGQLTGGIAHDFNNMLQSIGGCLEMMQRRVEQGRVPEAGRYIETARNEVERAAAFTHRLLASARQQTLQPRLMILDTCIAAAAELIRRAAGPDIAVEFLLDGQTDPVLCDPDQLESALLNLVVNARDAMPGSGTLIVATTNRVLAAADLVGHDGAKPGSYVELSVTDSGTGMTAHVATRAFEPFFTTKPIGQGSGLGLSQIYGFTRQSGGLARLESVLGEGTTVRLFLPCQVPFPKASALQPPPAWTGRGATVLVVEDEETVRTLIVEELREQGHTVLEAADGHIGVQVLQSDARVDLLVTDVGLPGINGRELADAARVGRPSLPVLLITGHAGAVLDIQLAPGMEVVRKPFALDVLADKARSMIEARAETADGGAPAAG